MSDVERLEMRLVELRGERSAVASTRTVEDMRELAATWLTSALGRVNGAAAGFIPNGNVGSEQVFAVVSEFLLSGPAFAEFVASKVEPRAELTNRQREARLKKLDGEIARAETEVREAAKLAALAEVEARFATPAGEAAA